MRRYWWRVGWVVVLMLVSGGLRGVCRVRLKGGDGWGWVVLMVMVRRCLGMMLGW